MRTLFLLAALTACVDQDVDDNLSEDTSDITVGSGSGIVIRPPDFKFHVSNLWFTDMDGMFKPAISDGYLGKAYTLAAVKPTVHVSIDFSKGWSIPANVGNDPYTDSYVYVQDPQSPFSAAPSNPMWGTHSYLDVSRWSNADRIWMLKGWVKVGNVQYDIEPVWLVIKRTSAFAVMNKTFDEERCQTCHSIDTPAKWKYLHEHTFKVPVKDDLTNVGDHEYCKTCHHEDIVADWRAPPASKNMNWSILTTAAERCAAVTSHLPTAAEITAHFHNDPRLLWSYYDENGSCMYNVPPLGPPIDEPFIFINTVDYWRDNGHDCAGLDVPRVPLF